MTIYGTFRVYYDTDNDGIPETNISADVVTNITGEYGSFSNEATDFLANAGRASFELDNSAGLYTSLEIGRRVDIKIYDGIYEKVIFSGKISPTKIDPRAWGNQRVYVQLDDWMKIANSNKMKGLQVQNNITSDDAMTMLIAPMARQPAHTNFAEGIELFPSVFDGASKNSNVYSEIDRIVKSELTHGYLTFRDADYGETLRLENQHTRGILTPLSTLPLNDAGVGFLKFHDTAAAFGKLKFHGAAGTSGFIKLSETQEAEFDRLHVDANWQRGDNIVNRFTVTDVSRVSDLSPVVLFDYEGDGEGFIAVGPSVPVRFYCGFTDPNDRGTRIAAKEIITPVPTTDYIFNSLPDGSGTDVTSLVIITLFEYDALAFHTEIITSADKAYCLKWNVRGKGIYKATNSDYIVENTQSIESLIGEQREQSIKREYSVHRDTSKTFANGVVALNRLPSNNMQSISFVASTEYLMRAFMFLDIGDKVRIIEGTPVKNGKFYIRGIKFALALGGLISFTWGLDEAIETETQPIAIVGPAVSSVSAIDFGILPYLANLDAFSYSFWIRRDATDATFNIINKTVDLGSGRRGNKVMTSSDGKIYFISYKTPTDGEWVTTNEVLVNLGQWYHVVLTYDNTTDTANPVIYIDGTSVAITETVAPSGTSDDDSDCPIILFNGAPNPLVPDLPYSTITHDMSLKDVRIYNHILSSGEVTTLEAGEDDYTTVPDGLLFQGIYAPTGFIDEYIGDAILEDDFVLDAVHGAAGIPYNENAPTDSRVFHGEAP